MIKKVFKKSALFIGTLIAVLMLGEALVRVILPSQLTSIHKYDPLLGWVTKPNLKGTFKGEHKRVKFKTNSVGNRGPEYSYGISDNFRILVLGDEYVEAKRVSNSEIFTAKLETSLRVDVNVELEVINTGTKGYSTDQELLYFKRRGYKYNPDLTILFFCYDDLIGNMESSNKKRFNKPYFKFINGSIRAKNVPVPIGSDVDYSNKEGLSIWYKEKVWLTFNSRLYSVIVRNQDRIQSNAELHEVVLEEDQLQDHLIMAEKLLRVLSKEIHKNKSEFMLFYVPHKIEIDSIWSKRYISGEEISASFKFPELSKRLFHICKQNRIYYVDPIEILREEIKSYREMDESLFINDGIEWNEKGHEIFARILQDHIINLDLTSKEK